jgi:pimeloyl-ACP methyl ester carboxylesterase
MAIGATHKEKSVISDGVNVVYDTYSGTSSQQQVDAPVLVWVHGWTCNAQLWHGQEPLYTKYRSIVLDLPGHGRSAAPHIDYHVELFGRAVNAVLDAESIKSAVIIGHSLGGPVATMAMRLSPERVKGIIYTDSFLHLPQAYITHTVRSVRSAAMADDRIFIGYLDDFFTAKTTEKVKKQVIDTMTSTDLHVRTGVVGTKASPQVWRWDETYDIPALHIGTVFYKEKDQEWSHHMPQLEMSNMQGYGHFMFMEAPEKFNAQVEGWMKSKKIW